MTEVRKLYNFADPSLNAQIAEIVRGMNGYSNNAVPIVDSSGATPVITGFKINGEVQSLIDLLNGQIRQSQLYHDLSSEIDSIATLNSSVTSINSQIQAINANLADLSVTPDYDNATTYQANDTVKYSGALYAAKQTTTGNLPTNTTYWDKIGDYASFGEALAAHAATLVQLAEADAAMVQDISALETSVGNNAAAIQTEATTRASADNATANTIGTLQTTVDGHTTAIQTQTASIDGIQGKYTVKIDNNGYVSGFGLISTANNGTPTSEFIILADRFSVVSPGKTAKIPFIVDSTYGVIINNAVIKNLTSENILADSISASSIKTSELVVGTNVTMGANATIAWGKVSGAPANLAGLDNTAATKLGTIEAYATVGATTAQLNSLNSAISSAATTAAWNSVSGKPTVYTQSQIEAFSTTITNTTVTTAFINALDVQAASLKANTAMVNTANIVIAAVDTLQIAGSAVIVSEGANQVGTRSTSGEVVSKAITIPAASGSVPAASVTVVCSCEASSTYAWAGVTAGTITLTRTTSGVATTLFTSDLFTTSYQDGVPHTWMKFMDKTSFNFKDSPGAGVHTYALNVSISYASSPVVKNGSIALVGTKR